MDGLNGGTRAELSLKWLEKAISFCMAAISHLAGSVGRAVSTRNADAKIFAIRYDCGIIFSWHVIIMQRILSIGLLLGASALAGCSSTVDTIMEKLPVYKIDVQQGNVITQDAVDRLRPGMEKRQVRFLLGTPLLEDVFHQDRWDYYYSFKPGGEKAAHERVSIFFEDERLARISGDYMPNPNADPEVMTQESLVVVPVLPPKDQSYWERFLNLIGIESVD